MKQALLSPRPRPTQLYAALQGSLFALGCVGMLFISVLLVGLACQFGGNLRHELLSVCAIVLSPGWVLLAGLAWRLRQATLHPQVTPLLTAGTLLYHIAGLWLGGQLLSIPAVELPALFGGLLWAGTALCLVMLYLLASGQATRPLRRQQGTHQAPTVFTYW